MGRTCTGCGEVSDSSVPDDEHNDACSCCGLVFSRGDFVATASFPSSGSEQRTVFRGRSQGYRSQNLDRKVETNAKIFCRADIKRIGEYMSCPELIIEQATSLFLKVCDHPEFHMRRLPQKRILAAGCLYITCRQNDRPISIKDVCSVAQCKAADLNHWKNRIARTFSLNVQSVNVLELTSARCQAAKLCNETSSRAKKIVQLYKDLDILEDHNPDNMISAAGYLAWLSIDPVSRRKTSFQSFCKSHKLVVTQRSRSAVDDVAGVLCRLAGEIPWIVASSVNFSTVSMHIDEILSYQTTLFSMSKEKFELSLAASDANDCKTEDTLMNEYCTSTCSSLVVQAPDIVPLSLDVKPRYAAGVSSVIESSVSVSEGSLSGSAVQSSTQLVPLATSVDNVEAATSFTAIVSTVGITHAARKHDENLKQADVRLFRFSRGRLGKDKRVFAAAHENSFHETSRHDLDSVELGSEDIPDSDMHLYLKSYSITPCTEL